MNPWKEALKAMAWALLLVPLAFLIVGAGVLAWEVHPAFAIALGVVLFYLCLVIMIRLINFDG